MSCVLWCFPRGPSITKCSLVSLTVFVLRFWILVNEWKEIYREMKSNNWEKIYWGPSAERKRWDLSPKANVKGAIVRPRGWPSSCGTPLSGKMMGSSLITANCSTSSPIPSYRLTKKERSYRGCMGCRVFSRVEFVLNVIRWWMFLGRSDWPFQWICPRSFVVR